MADPRATLAVELAAILARTATGTGSTLDLHEALEDTETLIPRSCARLFLDVSAVAGTLPTLTISIETSRDDSIWRTLDAFDVVSATGSTERLITGASRYVRAKWTIAGSAGQSFTFMLAGEALLVYATPTEVKNLALPEAAITTTLTNQKIGEHIIAACDDLDEVIGAVVEYPLATWGKARTLHIANYAAYIGMRFQGYAPEAGARDVFKDGRDNAVAWAEQTRDQERSAPSTTDATPDDNEGAVYIVTRTKRGW